MPVRETARWRGWFIRRIPQSAQAQMKHLVKQLKGTRATAQRLHF
ncbi:hypothetical protein ACFYOD_03430 [Streptomyces sp. NPDC006703]